jgi:serine/threonine protein kinase
MAQQSGDKFGNYQLLRQLGSGGYADVWLGEHILMGKEAAIKILKVELFDNIEQESYLQEARKTARLDHPHIVRVLECDIEQNMPFLVLEYAPNGTLRRRHPRGTPVPLDTVVAYTKQIASGLQYVHDRRLIHRDIKPENLLISPKNEIWLSDFGIALVAQSRQYQKTQDVMGTLGYMSPEQSLGRPVAASDQYALGVIVYEWLCGRMPFKGATLLEIGVQQQQRKLTLRDQIPDLPLAVEQTVLKALSYNLEDRFRNIQDFAETLERAAKEKGPLVIEEPGPIVFTPIPQSPGQPDPVIVNEPKIYVRNPTPHEKPTTPDQQTIPESAKQPSQDNNKPEWWIIGQQIPVGGPQTGFHGSTTIRPPVPQPGVGAVQGPYPATNEFRRKRSFDRNFLRSSKNRVFLSWGTIGDLLVSLLCGFWLQNGNVAVLSFMFLFIIRLLCTSATKKIVAIPLAWILALSWAVGVVALVALLKSTIYAFALLAFVFFWFAHDYFYARKKSARQAHR